RGSLGGRAGAIGGALRRWLFFPRALELPLRYAFASRRVRRERGTRGGAPPTCTISVSHPIDRRTPPDVPHAPQALLLDSRHPGGGLRPGGWRGGGPGRWTGP